MFFFYELKLMSQVADGCQYVEGFKRLRLLNLEYNCIEAWEELVKLSKLERSVYILWIFSELYSQTNSSLMTLCDVFLCMVGWNSFKLATTNWIRYCIQLRMLLRPLILFVVSSLVYFFNIEWRGYSAYTLSQIKLTLSNQDFLNHNVSWKSN
jgi:hypothetical protein